MKINQKKIAEDLDLSLATVSRAMRNHPSINDETRARVMDAAAAMGYRLPKGRASAAKTKQTQIGVLIHDDRAPGEDRQREYPIDYIAGISREANRNRAILLTHNLPQSEEPDLLDPRNQPAFMQSGTVAGLILIYRFPPDLVRRLSTQLPCVTITHRAAGSQADHVDRNATDAMAAAVEHLQKLGHRRIGFLGPEFSATFADDRFAAYVTALAACGIPYDPAAVVNVFGERVGYDAQAEAVAALIRGGVTAWICANDLLGYNLYVRLNRLGVSIPADASIVGFDGSVPPIGCPQLATTHFASHELGTIAVQLLLDRIETPQRPARHVAIRGTFDPGETVAQTSRG